MSWNVICNGIAISEQISGLEKSVVLGKFVVMTRECCTVRSYKQSVNFTWSWTCQIWTLKGFSITICWRDRPLLSRLKSLVFGFKSICWSRFWNLKSGGQLWALEDYWTQVGTATGHSAAVTDFTWSPAHISVSNFGFSLGVYHLVNLWTLTLLSARHIVFGWA